MKKGFTLIELAIVLVIIGLLVAGVLQGQELIKQSQIRKILRQINETNIAASTFKLKYNQLPGDFKGATNIWGSRTNCADIVELLSPRVGSNTCNGNNDGALVVGEIGSIEAFGFWEHLENAQLISQHFPNNHYVAMDDTEMDFSGYKTGVNDIYIGAYGPYDLQGITRTSLFLGKIADDTGGAPMDNKVPPEIAYGIDSKLDDGKPNSGGVTVTNVYSGGSTSCRDGQSPPGYDMQDDTNICALMVRPSF